MARLRGRLAGAVAAMMLAAVSGGSAQEPAVLAPFADIDLPNATRPDEMSIDPGSGPLAVTAIAQGRWSVACAMATRVLARRVADTDALGVFALCTAVQGDRQAAEIASRRLRDVEPVRFYAPLTEGVLALQAGDAPAALTILEALAAARAGDPLVQYFRGEALHAARRDAEALAAFRVVVAAWPDNVPALSAAAQLTLASREASPDDLAAGVAMAEHATRREPWQRRHWLLLAELCRRSGQEARAQAIALQWLTPGPRP